MGTERMPESVALAQARDKPYVRSPDSESIQVSLACRAGKLPTATELDVYRPANHEFCDLGGRK